MSANLQRKKRVTQRYTIAAKNYEGSAKIMESAAILKMVTDGPSLGYVVDWIVSDDKSTMRAHLKHPRVDDTQQQESKKRRKTAADKDKDMLPSWIPEPVFKDDPTHRNKVVLAKFFDLVKKRISESWMNNQLAKRLKKDWGYMVSQNKHQKTI